MYLYSVLSYLDTYVKTTKKLSGIVIFVCMASPHCMGEISLDGRLGACRSVPHCYAPM